MGLGIRGRRALLGDRRAEHGFGNALLRASCPMWLQQASRCCGFEQISGFIFNFFNYFFFVRYSPEHMVSFREGQMGGDGLSPSLPVPPLLIHPSIHPSTHPSIHPLLSFPHGVWSPSVQGLGFFLLSIQLSPPSSERFCPQPCWEAHRLRPCSRAEPLFQDCFSFVFFLHR